MGRPMQLRDTTVVQIVLEKEQLERLDKAAGPGNRSAYLRFMVDTIDVRQIQNMLKQKAKIKMLKELPAKLEKEILKKETKIKMLRRTIKQLKTGKPVDLKDVPGMIATSKAYQKWRKSLEDRGIEVTRGKELDWVKIRAKDVDVEPRELIAYLNITYLGDLKKWVE